MTIDGGRDARRIPMRCGTWRSGPGTRVDDVVCRGRSVMTGRVVRKVRRTRTLVEYDRGWLLVDGMVGSMALHARTLE